MTDTNKDAEMEARITALELTHQDIRDDLRFIKETLVNADSTITRVAAEVMPTVQELMNSPMLKMLGMKKK